MTEKFAPTSDFMLELLSAIKFAIVVADADTRVRYVNPFAEALFGFRESEMTGRELSRLFMAEDEAVFLPNILTLTRRQGGYEGETLLRGAGGRTIWAWLSTALYHDQAGTEFLILVVNEIARLKKLEHRFREAQRFASLGRLTDRIAHHVRNPVMSLGGFARRLLGKPDMAQSQRESYLSIIAQEAKRLENIVDQAGAFSRLPPPRPEPVELGLIIDRSLETCRPRAAAAPGVSCDATVSDDLRQRAVRVDAALLVIGLTKVIDNALDAVVEAAARGRSDDRLVRVEAAVDDRDLVLAVSDTGCGIAAADAEFIFDPFFTTKPDHVGMGLTISKRIVEDHGGRIDFQTAPGGSCFQLFTPLERRRPERSRLL